MKIQTPNSSRDTTGAWGSISSWMGWGSEDGIEDPVRSKSRQQPTRTTRMNPIAGNDWRKLLKQIPSRVKIGNVSYAEGSLPPSFRHESLFLARIWAKRFQLSSPEEQVLADEILEERSRRWSLMVEKGAAFEHEGRQYLLAGAHTFQKELWAEYWLKEMGPILQKLTESHPMVESALARDETLFELAKKAQWPDEMVESYLGEVSPRVDSKETVLQKLALLREDEVLFLFWVLPELNEILENTEDMK